MPMSGFLAFLALVAVFVIVVRYLRKREVEAFMGEDLTVLKDFKPAKGPREPDQVQSPIVDVEALTARYPGVVKAAIETGGPDYELRELVFDEIHRNLLDILDQMLPSAYRVFVQVPLSAFVREVDGNASLYGKSVSVLVCERATCKVAFAILLRGAGAMEMENHRFLEELFRKLDRPLVVLPMVSGISREEVSDAISALIPL